MQEQEKLNQRLTFNSADELRKFIQATLLDPKLEFNIDNDPNSTSLNKFLNIIEHNKLYLDEDNKSYLANLLQNHLSHILRKYAKQETAYLTINLHLDAFIKRLSLENLYASPASSPQIGARGAFDASLFLAPVFAPTNFLN